MTCADDAGYVAPTPDSYSTLVSIYTQAMSSMYYYQTWLVTLVSTCNKKELLDITFKLNNIIMYYVLENVMCIELCNEVSLDRSKF